MALLPARIRRLTVAEYQATVSSDAVIGAAADGVSASFVPDSRQSGFTVNDAQRVDPVLAGELADAATKLAAEVRAHVTERAPCQNPATDADQCATTFIRSFGENAYRRPLADDEVTQLLALFHTALDGGSYAEGIELTVKAMLQSASFIYLTEIGDGPASSGSVKLTPYELASSISYLTQGGPPSPAMVAAAKAGQLDTPEGRVAQLSALKVFQSPEAAARVVRVVREWLGTDKVADLAKDSNVYADFAALKNDIAQETGDFIQALVTDGQDGGSLAQLLAGDWSVASKPLAKLYGVTSPSDAATRIALPKRLGVLNQSAFLSVFAHASETAPVLRGVAVMRRVACVAVGDPAALNIVVVPPLPDPTKSTRQRYAVHATDVKCAACHDSIDNFGFAFEGFDGMGRARTVDGKNDQGVDNPVDSSVVVSGTDFAGSYADSNALVKAMSASKQVRECFARHVYRALSGTSAPELQQSEDDFLKYWTSTLPAGAAVPDAKLVGTIAAYIESPAFAYRRAP